MKKIPTISESEWYVMRLAWELERPTFSQIKKELRHMNWSDNTISTFLVRLVRKGALQREGSPKEYRYIPLVSEAEYMRRENQSFVDRLYRGSVVSLLRNFIRQESIREEEAEELIRLLKGEENEGK